MRTYQGGQRRLLEVQAKKKKTGSNGTKTQSMKSPKQTLEFPISTVGSQSSESRLPRREGPRSTGYHSKVRKNLKSKREQKRKGLQIKSIKYIFPNRLGKLKKMSNIQCWLDYGEIVLYIAYSCAIVKNLSGKQTSNTHEKILKIHMHFDPATTRIYLKKTIEKYA